MRTLQSADRTALDSISAGAISAVTAHGAMPARPGAARRRFHTARVIAKRIKVAREIAHCESARSWSAASTTSGNYIGCSRPRCCACSPHKNLPNASAPTTRTWRGLEERAS
jgi:hypothetical protein